MSDEPDPRYSERRPGPTPAGGVSSIAFWMDEHGDPCTREEAVQVEIHELDEEGGSIARTYGRLDGRPYPPAYG
jgi:hypothetical protein